MNREILFRAKAINRNPNREYRTNYKNGDWVYGLLTEKPYESSFGILPAHMTNEEGVSGIDVDYDTLGQYTGLKYTIEQSLENDNLTSLERIELVKQASEYNKWLGEAKYKVTVWYNFHLDADNVLQLEEIKLDK